MALNLIKIGKRISEIRKRRGLTQWALAERVNKSPTYISYIENGIKCMSLDTFVSIANTLQVSADELLMDSIENTVKVSNHEFTVLLSDCNEFEKRIMMAIASTAKNAIRENQYLLSGRRGRL